MKRIALLGAGFGHHYVHQTMNLGVVRDTGRLVVAIDPAYALIELANPLRSLTFRFAASLDDFWLVMWPIYHYRNADINPRVFGESMFGYRRQRFLENHYVPPRQKHRVTAPLILRPVRSVLIPRAYSPAWRQVKRLLREGAFGEPEALYACACWLRNAAYYQRPVGGAVAPR